MLGRIFITICTLRPVRKFLWRRWYEFLAGQYRAADWTFKLALIQKLVPRPLRRSFFDFAAMRGSAIYEGFRTRKLVYLAFVLQREGIQEAQRIDS